MKATGIVRRIDELGRVVIPKEIRRTQRIREGDPLEIFTDREGGIILKKYSPIGELSGYAAEFAQSLSQTFQLTAAICDKDMFIACAGAARRELQDKRLSAELESLVAGRSGIQRSAAEGTMPLLAEGAPESLRFGALALVPIHAHGDAIGAVLALTREDVTEIEHAAVKACELVAAFFGKLMEQP